METKKSDISIARFLLQNLKKLNFKCSKITPFKQRHYSDDTPVRTVKKKFFLYTSQYFECLYVEPHEFSKTQNQYSEYLLRYFYQVQVDM